MPAQRTAQASTSAKTGKTKSKYALARPKRVKPELPVEEKVKKLWRSAKDQIQDGYPAHAVKTVQKIITLDPSNSLAKQTHLQLLLSLDKYAEALAYASAQEQQGAYRIEECYALYKLGRMEEADKVLESLREIAANDADTARTLDVLDAQIKYRLESFEDSQALYEDLLATVEDDSPEHDDLQTNLAACSAHLDFVSSVPSLLGDLASAGKLPSIENLESNPVAPLIAAHPGFKQRAQPLPSTSATAATANEIKPAKKAKKAAVPAKKKTTKLPASIAALPEDQRPAPDPERWLPKRERKGYAEQMAAKEKEKEKRRLKARKKQEATLTQGAEESAGKGTTSGGSKGAQQSKKTAKKKGKK